MLTSSIRSYRLRLDKGLMFSRYRLIFQRLRIRKSCLHTRSLRLRDLGDRLLCFRSNLRVAIDRLQSLRCNGNGSGNTSIIGPRCHYHDSCHDNHGTNDAANNLTSKLLTSQGLPDSVPHPWVGLFAIVLEFVVHIFSVFRFSNFFLSICLALQTELRIEDSCCPSNSAISEYSISST